MFLIFSFSILMVWDGWKRYQHPEQYAQSQVEVAQSATNKTLPSVTATASVPGAAAITEQYSPSQATGKALRVKTDTIDAEINTLGGDISYLALLKHPDAQDKNKPVVLFHRGEGTHNYVAQSGLLGNGLPNHNSEFVADQESYELAETAEQLTVRLKARSTAPLQVTKVLTFHKNSYSIDVAYELENHGSEEIKTNGYFQLVRNSAAPEGSSVFMPTYTGAAVYTEAEKFQKVDFSTIEKGKTDYPKQSADGWIGILQHYFVAAWLPQQGVAREYFTRKLDGDQYAVGVILPELTVAPGQKAGLSNRLYVGPTESDLDKVAPGLGLTVDYGWLTVVSTPLFWVLSLLNDWVGNWGVAIILLTILIKLAFFPLSAASYRSMAKMRVVAPKLEKIKKQYGDDREKLNRAMMDLYKTEKINPLGGCLPILIQIPVFIALYWAILASVEIRYAPFFGWITDLSAADPYYILPVIMGVSMVVQMRLNPTPPDPLQAKVMQIMPIAFSVIFFFFPAGLVLYSIVNNLLSIAQQWYITRSIENEKKGVVANR